MYQYYKSFTYFKRIISENIFSITIDGCFYRIW